MEIVFQCTNIKRRLLKKVLKRENIILTTSTGSGKTEAMFLPIISSLLNEAKNWEKPLAKQEF